MTDIKNKKEVMLKINVPSKGWTVGVQIIRHVFTNGKYDVTWLILDQNNRIMTQGSVDLPKGDHSMSDIYFEHVIYEVEDYFGEHVVFDDVEDIEMDLYLSGVLD